MRKNDRGQRIDTVFVLAIFCVFAISVLMVLMLGANIYQNVNGMTQEGYVEHLALSYIWTKVKNGDDSGKISVGDFNGHPALCFDEEYGQTQYSTLIYYYNGWIYELFSEKDLGLSPEDGTQILRVDKLSFETLNYGIIKVSSGASSLLISPRSGIEYSLPGTDSGEEVFIG